MPACPYPDFKEFIISSEGVGDVSLSVSRPLWRAESRHIMGNLGLSLPTGSIDEIGPTPRVPGTDTRLPFTMQIGSGTFDLAPSLSIVGSGEPLAWGGELRAKVRLGENDLGLLTEEFNDMLQQMQQRDEELEQRVDERTAELSDSNKMLQDSLSEKVVLLKEIRHRVKNSMQIISSLLSLQTRQITDPVMVEMFQNSRNRIRAMASIHERLYQSDDLAKVDFTQYLTGLADYLLQSYKIRPQDIRFHSEVEDVALDLDHAIGFPADVDFRSSESLGLQLINTLVNQLHGSIEMRNHLGTQFTIEFPGDKLDTAAGTDR